MSPEILTLYNFTLSMCERLMADISQEEMEVQPTKGVNTPAWILGHLAICTDFALNLLGQPMRLPKSWHAEFGPGSSPLPQRPPYPSREELLAALCDGHAAVVAALSNADEKVLAGPNPLSAMPFLVQTLPTVAICSRTCSRRTKRRTWGIFPIGGGRWGGRRCFDASSRVDNQVRLSSLQALIASVDQRELVQQIILCRDFGAVGLPDTVRLIAQRRLGRDFIDELFGRGDLAAGRVPLGS